MNVLVAGATGAIGRPLISALVSARHNVFGMTSSKLGLQTLKEDGAEGLLASALDAQAVDVRDKESAPGGRHRRAYFPAETLHTRRDARGCRARP